MGDSQARPPSWDATLYQDKHAFVWKYGADLLDLLSPQPGERILDVGCGTGQLTQKIADRSAIAMGIDRSPQMIAQARNNFPLLRFELADATDFDLGDTFDGVFSNAALHWVKPPEKAVACIWRALNPGGRFVAEFGGRGNVSAIIQSMLAAAGEIGCPLPQAVNPWYYPSVGQYAGLLESHGFEVTMALLFDRPTPLEDGEAGLRNWVKMFGPTFLAAIPRQKHEMFFEAIERKARPALFRESRWFADYRRLRIVARRKT